MEVTSRTAQYYTLFATEKLDAGKLFYLFLQKHREKFLLRDTDMWQWTSGV